MLPTFAVYLLVKVLIEGKTAASLDRNKGVKVSLPVLDTADKDFLTLDILVEGIGRDNSGSKFDLKGLVSQDVYLNGESLSTHAWLVYPAQTLTSSDSRS